VFHVDIVEQLAGFTSLLAANVCITFIDLACLVSV